MYEYIKGALVESNPSYAIIEANGIGYFINISLHTYTKITADKQENKVADNTITLYIHQLVREDLLAFYGFYSKEERGIFLNLISVSGVGANTARMILSSLSPVEIQEAILEGKVNVLKNIKGIGAKSAQRIIVDLKDKIGKPSGKNIDILAGGDNTIREEALSALLTLGFTKKGVEKELDKILSQHQNLSIEELVKMALKQL